MGEVYQVRNVLSDRVEAIKVLSSGLQANPDLQERFLREIKISAALRHPHIAELRTAQRVDGLLIMVMEFVDGVTVDTLLHEGPLPPQNALHYTAQVLEALSFAHGRGVVHRDIKPQNIMVVAGDDVRLMDFGIARSLGDHGMTMTGMTLGSLYYMSPEQIRGEHADHRADLYSLGITLYEMVTGSRPFEGSSGYTVMAAHLDQAPAPPVERNPALPDALNDVILKAIEKQPAARYQTADEFLEAVRSLMGTLGGSVDDGILQRALSGRGSNDAATSRTPGTDTPTQTLPVTPTPPGGRPARGAPTLQSTPAAAEPQPVVAAKGEARGMNWLGAGGMFIGLLAVVLTLGPRFWNAMTGGSEGSPQEIRDARRQGARMGGDRGGNPPDAPTPPPPGSGLAIEGPRDAAAFRGLSQEAEADARQAMEAAEAALKEAGIEMSFGGGDGRPNRRFGGFDRADAMLGVAKRYRAAQLRREQLAERRRGIPNLIRAMTEQERQATMGAMGDQWRKITESIAAAEAAIKSQNLRLAGEELAVAESAMDSVDRSLAAIQQRHGGATPARP